MKVGFWYLTDENPGDPLPAAACLDVAGADAAGRSPWGLMRIYEEKQRPEPAIYTQKILAWARSRPGWLYQLSNESNLESERFGGTAADYAAWVERVRVGLPPEISVGVGAFSPGDRIVGVRNYSDIEGWDALYPMLDADSDLVAILHVYAPDLPGLKASFLRQAQRLPDHTAIVVGECNFGPGASVHVDRDRWADDALRPFLDWLALDGGVRACFYFAHRWPDPEPWFAGGTPVDGTGTRIETILRAWSPPSTTQDGAGVAGEPGDGDPAVVPGNGESPFPGSTGATMQLGLMFRMGQDIPETTVDRVGDLCRRGGFSIISPKVKEAEAWMGGPERWQDKDPVLAITGVESLLAQRDAYAAHGITMHPWAVYRGLDWEAEARAHAEVANLLKVLVVDFEWRYPGFADHGTWPDVVDYCRLLRQLTPGAKLVLCPDPRQLERGEYAVGEITGSFDAYSPQCYYTDFQQDAPDVLAAALRVAPPGLAVWPMLPGDSDPVDLDAGIGQLLHAEAGPVFYVFQRVGLKTENLPVLKAWSERVPVEPVVHADWESTVLAPINRGAQAVFGMADATEDDRLDATTIVQRMDLIKARHTA